VQNFYQLLSVEPTATAEEIKRAFRSEIARYHPDKVQHLGKEFQELAATRAASLTEAYRTLMNTELRADYDLTYLGPATATANTAWAGARSDSTAAPHAPPRTPPEAPAGLASEPGFPPPPRFASERRDRDDFVKKATLGRFRKALAAELGTMEESTTRGFDLDCEAKSKGLFSRNGRRRFAIRIVPLVNRLAVQDAWSAAQKAGTPICVFLMGNGVAPAAELAEAIADMRKKSREKDDITIIPVDVRDWSAHMPTDAPPACKGVLKRLRDSSA
jgi:curved DNA-binding protein CbpA